MSQATIVEQESPSKYRSTTVLLALWLGHFAVDSFTGIWPIYKTLANLDLVKAGMIATVGGFIGNSLQIIFGIMGDRGWNRFLLCFGAIAAGTVVLLPYVDHSNYLVMGVLVMFTFLGSSAYHPSATGTASALSSRSTGKLTAIFLSGGFIGYAFSQLLFTKVYTLTNGNTAIMLVVSVVAAVILMVLVPNSEQQLTKQSKFLEASRGRRRPLTYLYVVMVCTAGVNMALVFLLPDFLQAKGAPSWMVFGVGHLLLVLGGCIGLLPAGYLSDKYGPRQIMMGGLVALAFLMPAVVWFESSNWFLFGFFLLLLGISTSTCNVVGVAYGSKLMPRHTRTVSGLLMGTAWCVAGVSTAIGGWLADPRYGGSPQEAILWLIIAVIVAFVFSYLLPRANTFRELKED